MAIFVFAKPAARSFNWLQDIFGDIYHWRPQKFWLEIALNSILIFEYSIL